MKTLDDSATISELRSMMWVAPSDLRRSVLRSDAVVTMGLNPDNLASWIAMTRVKGVIKKSVILYTHCIVLRMKLPR